MAEFLAAQVPVEEALVMAPNTSGAYAMDSDPPIWSRFAAALTAAGSPVPLRPLERYGVLRGRRHPRGRADRRHGRDGGLREPAAPGGSRPIRPDPADVPGPEGAPDVAVHATCVTHDVRFPTSRALDGSDAMNPDPDYSAAYVVLRTDAGDGLEGHGFAFTIGRGNDVQVAAIGRSRRWWSAATSTRCWPTSAARRRARRRQAAALAGPGEGRHAHGHRRGRQRRVGPARPGARASRCGSCWPT